VSDKRDLLSFAYIQLTINRGFLFGFASQMFAFTIFPLCFFVYNFFPISCLSASTKREVKFHVEDK
jgi:hypothetical protein